MIQYFRFMTLESFIRKRPYLIWYTKNYAGLSAESIVEATLNYGDWDDVQKLIKILGIKRTARIFEKDTHRARVNYHPKTVHFFHLYFNRHVA